MHNTLVIIYWDNYHYQDIGFPLLHKWKWTCTNLLSLKNNFHLRKLHQDHSESFVCQQENEWYSNILCHPYINMRLSGLLTKADHLWVFQTAVGPLCCPVEHLTTSYIGLSVHLQFLHTALKLLSVFQARSKIYQKYPRPAV